MQTSTATNIVHVSSDTFEQEVLKANRPVLVDFWAPWCGPCRMLAPVLESMAAHFGDRLRIAKVNVDENPDLAGIFRVQGIPSLKLISGGRLAAEWTGYLPEPVLTLEVSKALDRLEKGDAGNS